MNRKILMYLMVALISNVCEANDEDQFDTSFLVGGTNFSNDVFTDNALYEQGSTLLTYINNKRVGLHYTQVKSVDGVDCVSSTALKTDIPSYLTSTSCMELIIALGFRKIEMDESHFVFTFLAVVARKASRFVT